MAVLKERLPLLDLKVRACWHLRASLPAPPAQPASLHRTRGTLTALAVASTQYLNRMRRVADADGAPAIQVLLGHDNTTTRQRVAELGEEYTLEPFSVTVPGTLRRCVATRATDWPADWLTG
jgi:hypothetical protein